MLVAHLVKLRSTCIRRRVGAVLVKGTRIVATGYNGVPVKFRHCTDVGCLREVLKIPSGLCHELCRGLHAEMNAIIQAAVFGVSTVGCKLYVTTYPCTMCAKMIANAGISEVIYDSDYEDELAKSIFDEAGIVVRRFVLRGELMRIVKALESLYRVPEVAPSPEVIELAKKLLPEYRKLCSLLSNTPLLDLRSEN